jgi:hypothetical protein
VRESKEEFRRYTRHVDSSSRESLISFFQPFPVLFPPLGSWFSSPGQSFQLHRERNSRGPEFSPAVLEGSICSPLVHTRWPTWGPTDLWPESSKAHGPFTACQPCLVASFTRSLGLLSAAQHILDGTRSKLGDCGLVLVDLHKTPRRACPRWIDRKGTDARCRLLYPTRRSLYEIITSQDPPLKSLDDIGKAGWMAPKSSIDETQVACNYTTFEGFSSGFSEHHSAGEE